MSNTEELFRGYVSPKYTQIPDVLFDEQLPDLSGAELKVLLYIMRRTFGFKKDADNISMNQIASGITTREGTVLDRGTGLSKSTVQVAIKGLVDKRIVITTKRVSPEHGNEATTYQLNLGDTPYTENRYRGIPEIGTALYRKSAQQDTDEQETVNNNSNNRTASAENGENKRNGETVRLGEAVARWQRGRSLNLAHDGRGEGNGTARSTGTIVSRRRPAAPRRVVQQDEDYQTIQAYVADFARELNDRASLRVSTTRAYNLYRRAGLDRAEFLERMLAARAIAKERTSQIRSTGEPGPLGTPLKHRAAYYFAVLEDLLGFRPGVGEPAELP